MVGGGLELHANGGGVGQGRVKVDLLAGRTPCGKVAIDRSTPTWQTLLCAVWVLSCRE